MGSTGNEMVGWHHQLKGHEFEQTPEVSQGQGSLESMAAVYDVLGSKQSCSPWVAELEMTE